MPEVWEEKKKYLFYGERVGAGWVGRRGEKIILFCVVGLLAFLSISSFAIVVAFFARDIKLIYIQEEGLAAAVAWERERERGKKQRK